MLTGDLRIVSMDLEGADSIHACFSKTFYKPRNVGSDGVAHGLGLSNA